jgi:hypothetical protein
MCKNLQLDVASQLEQYSAVDRHFGLLGPSWSPKFNQECSMIPRTSRIFLPLSFAAVLCAQLAGAQTLNPSTPTWWNKYQHLLKNGADGSVGVANSSLSAGANVDASNECGPQSETYITLNPNHPAILTAGSNEIFRLPMRGYFSSDNGSSWAGVDLPLPPAIGANGVDFGSDPSLVFDTRGNVFYSYIVIFISANFGGINGTEMAVARSTNGGRSYPGVTYFSFQSGQNHFNDKPMITADTNLLSPFRDNVYLAWDAASGGSTSGGIRVATSADHGTSFSITRADNPSGPGRGIGAVPFVGPNGEVYVAWNDFGNGTIAFNRSLDGGTTWGAQGVIAAQRLGFETLIPAESFRGALVYPSCAADRSSGPHRGRLYCSWMDLATNGMDTDIFLAFSDDLGGHWSTPKPVTDQLGFAVDRFNHWLSVDPVTGDVNVSFYDTRNDTTGQRFQTDTYFTQSQDGGVTWQTPNLRVTTVSSNEHDCNGAFPCNGIDYGNQQGDYEGLVSYGGVSHPIWTDSRDQLNPSPGCRTGLAMEEVFSATVR